MIMDGSVLNEQEMGKIHKESIRILEQVGVRVPSEKALSLLEAAGGCIDWDKKTAKISEKMVKEAIAAAPKEFTLGARDSRFDLSLPAEKTVFNMDGAGPNIIDFETGKRRLGTTKDLADIGKVFDSMPSARVLWSSVIPSDVSGTSQNVVGSGISLINCCKHLQDEVTRIEEVPYIIEMCKTILGSEKEIGRRNIYSVCYCPVAPLTHARVVA